MPTLKMTDAAVQRVVAAPGERTDYFDAHPRDRQRGLVLRVSAGAEGAVSRTWAALYRIKGSNRLRRLTIGDYPTYTLAQARSSPALSAEFSIPLRIPLRGEITRHASQRIAKPQQHMHGLETQHWDKYHCKEPARVVTADARTNVTVCGAPRSSRMPALALLRKDSPARRRFSATSTQFQAPISICT
jgi:Arm DNA-binding domain